MDNPFKIAQSDQSLCGPLGIMFLLAKNNPERYGAMARAIYEDGQFPLIGGKVLKVGSHLFSTATPNNISSADWMLGATMRDAANALFKFEPSDKFAGITLPGEMEAWMKTLLGCQRAETETTFAYGENSALEKAGNAVQAGNIAVLLVDAGYMPGHKPCAVNIPTHWIVLLDVKSTKGTINFDVYSWGKLINITKSQQDFEDLMFGTVIGYY